MESVQLNLMKNLSFNPGTRQNSLDAVSNKFEETSQNLEEPNEILFTPVKRKNRFILDESMLNSCKMSIKNSASPKN